MNGISPKPTILGKKQAEDSQNRKSVRMVWHNPSTASQNSPYRKVYNLAKHETASGSQYARFKHERAIARNYNDTAL
jgi:hypothetical protein